MKVGSIAASAVSLGVTVAYLSLIMFALLGLMQAAWAESVFNADATEACVTDVLTNSTNRSSYAVLECPGRSARICMTQPGNDNTLGMIECLSIESDYWEQRMAVALSKQRAAAEQGDNEKPLFRSNIPSQVESLEAMQKAWEQFRNAACLYEQALWLGGTGSGPATVSCHLHETARQTLKLEGWWAE